MSVTQRVPPELQQLMVKYQQIENQLAAVITEKNVVLSEITEINRALDLLNSIEEGTDIFKNAGLIMVKVKKDDVVKELTDRKEFLELKLKSIEKNEQILRKQLDETRSKINEYASRVYGAAGKAG
jgi:prefoldin beta subunit